jgi:SAM-dependent methyltransferase
MGYYHEHVLPHLINCACSTRPISRQRQKIVPDASGRVLEVGMGSGLNIEYYDPDKVELLWGLEPSHGMRRKAARRVAASRVPLRWLDLPGEEIPLDDNSVDTVVLICTLCTIPDWRTALAQMKRVLKPGGRLLFSEHGLAPDEEVRRWQRRLNPVWQGIAGGCHLNRNIPELLREGGFGLHDVDAMYLPSTPRFAGFTYWGWAD